MSISDQERKFHNIDTRQECFAQAQISKLHDKFLEHLLLPLPANIGLNTLAYLSRASVTIKGSFITLTPVNIVSQDNRHVNSKINF